ncbi:MAG: hypothetical protein H6Q68_1417 [Firmicutes bacterium]|nr:hypothetical protein [Bacillota bacterium]
MEVFKGGFAHLDAMAQMTNHKELPSFFREVNKSALSYINSYIIDTPQCADVFRNQLKSLELKSDFSRTILKISNLKPVNDQMWFELGGLTSHDWDFGVYVNSFSFDKWKKEALSIEGLPESIKWVYQCLVFMKASGMKTILAPNVKFLYLDENYVPVKIEDVTNLYEGIPIPQGNDKQYEKMSRIGNMEAWIALSILDSINNNQIRLVHKQNVENNLKTQLEKYTLKNKYAKTELCPDFLLNLKIDNPISSERIILTEAEKFRASKMQSFFSLLNQNLIKKALPELEDYLKIYPNDSEFLYHKAQCFRNLKDKRFFDVALKCKKIMSKEKEWHGLFALGHNFMRFDDPKNAINCFKECLIMTQNQYERNQILLAIGHCERTLNNHPKALDTLQKALASGNVDVYIEMARTYWEMGDILQSITSLEKGLEIEPNNQGLHLNLGMLYLQNNQKEEALSEIDFLKENGYFESAKELNDLVQTVREIEKGHYTVPLKTNPFRLVPPKE